MAARTEAQAAIDTLREVPARIDRSNRVTGHCASAVG